MSLISQTILSDGNILYFKELKVKHLKQIFKCTLGDEFDKEILLYNVNDVLSQLIEICPSKLNFLDYFILLLQIRMTSIGKTIKVQLNTNTTMEINLEEIFKIFKKVNFESFLSPDKFNDQITIYYHLPTILEILQFTKTPENIFYYFLDKIEIEKEIYIFKNILECEKIINHIPSRFFSTINKKIQNIIHYFNQINLLSYNSFIKEPILYFNFNINNLCFLIKLFFGDHLMALYENIFALCKIGNFTPEYIENCSPGEYLLYVKKLEEYNKLNTEQPQETIHSLEPDMFGDSGFDEPLNPYKSSNLPPITSSFSG